MASSTTSSTSINLGSRNFSRKTYRMMVNDSLAPNRAIKGKTLRLQPVSGAFRALDIGQRRLRVVLDKACAGRKHGLVWPTCLLTSMGVSRPVVIPPFLQVC
eukprot:scaffold99128_cov80-Phaeocystis_antarctica.AAC.1